MAIFALMGVLSLFFLWNTQRSAVFYIGNSVMHLPLLCGWIYLATKGSLKRRFHKFWTPYGLAVIVFVFLTVVFADVVEKGPLAFFNVSETFWYALAYGLLFAFFSLRSAKPLWYSMFFIAIFWNLQTLSLLSQAVGVDITLRGPPTLDSYFRSGKFWNDWGWFISDMIVDIPMALVSLYFILLAVQKIYRNKFLRLS